MEAHRDLVGIHSHIRHVDRSINHIAAALFGDDNAATAMMKFVRPSGQPLVDDWDCFKELVSLHTLQEYYVDFIHSGGRRRGSLILILCR